MASIKSRVATEQPVESKEQEMRFRKEKAMRNTSMILAALGALALAVPAQADVIIANENSGGGTTFPNQATGKGVAFQMNTGLDTYILETAELLLSGIDEEETAGVAIWAGENGVPSTKLADLTSGAALTSGWNSFSSDTDVYLQADGLYFLTIVQGTGTITWEGNSQNYTENLATFPNINPDPEGAFKSYIFGDSADPTQWTLTSGSENSFRINAIVPEPATMSLLGLGGLVALRRRRK